MLSRYKSSGFLVIIVTTLITVALYLLSKPSGYQWQSSWLRSLSQVLALLGTLYLSITFILSSRVRLIENIFGGLDIVYKLHHILGALSFVLLLHHPLLLAVQQLPNVELAKKYIIPGSEIALNAGIFALVLMALLIILTMFIKLPYHIWKQTHTWMGGALFLAMVHVFLINSDISRYMPLRIWMLFWMFSAALSFALKKFTYKWYADSYKYKVAAIEEIDTIVKLDLAPVGEESMKFVPGQFVFLEVLNNSSIGSESHPFSIASSPDEDVITLFCRKTGDYVDRLLMLEPDALVNLNGPYGTFMEKIPFSKHVVGIAGGVGFTPFLSLVKTMQKDHSYPHLTLFHAVRFFDDSPFSKEKYTASNVEIIIHDSEHEGYLTADSVVKDISTLKDVTFFLCGPPVMMESMRNDLIDKGVRPSRIIFEDFGFK